MRVLCTYILFLLGVLLFNNIHAQSSELDSLKRELKNLKEDTNRVFLLNKIARQFFFLSNQDSSFSYATKTRILAEKLLAENKTSHTLFVALQKGIAMSYNVVGLNYSFMGDYTKALNNLNTSLEICQKINDRKGEAAAYGNIGNVYHEQGRYPDALKIYLVTLKIREEIKDKKGMANSFLSLGNVYSIMHNYKASLKYYSKAVVLFEEFGDKYSLAGTYSNIAGVYTGKGYYDQALKMYDSYLDIMKEFEDQQSIASTYGNIGNIYVYQGKFEKALKEYQEALKISETIDDEPGMALSNINIGQAYFKLNDFKKTEIYTLKGLEYSKKVNEFENLRMAYSALSDLYEKTGKPQKALENYKLYISYRDSITNRENTEETTRIEMNYEFDKKQAAEKLEQSKKDAVSVAERNKQRTIIWGIGIILFFVIGFAFFVYRSSLQKQKANLEIIKQKHIIEEKQKEIIDSIYYARRIQRALLTSEKYIERNLDKLIKKT
jgi:tetratricopeptide (TPR) repeat protein